MEEKKGKANEITQEKNRIFVRPPPADPQSILAQKNEKGQYFWQVPTSGKDISAKQLEKNGNDLWEAGRYEEALVCYENALAKRPKTDIKRENTLVNYATYLTTFEHYEKALDALKEALSLIQDENRPGHYKAGYGGEAWIINQKIKTISTFIEQNKPSSTGFKL